MTNQERKDTIKCPECSAVIPVTETLQHQLTGIKGVQAVEPRDFQNDLREYEEELKAIDDNKTYSLYEIHKNKWFGISIPDSRSFNTVKEIVKRDVERKNLLQASVRGVNVLNGGGKRGRRYRVKGENLKRFLREIAEGKY